MAAPAVEHDLLIVGAGPAGAAAAIQARRLSLSALLIERARYPRELACGGWMGPAGVSLCLELSLKPGPLGAIAFRGLTIHSWDFKRKAEAADPELAGWIIERGAFDAALLKAAAGAGASIAAGVWPVAVELRETHVCVRLSDERRVTGRVLLIADGALSQTAQLAALPSAASAPDRTHSLYATCASAGAPGVHVAIGATREAKLATIVRDGRQARVSLVTRDSRTAPQDQFRELWLAAQHAGALPAAASAPQARDTPTGVALDLDSHVGKRCLLIGDAGGFVCAFSHEGIYPAMKSGCVAVEVAAAALPAPLIQDELGGFEAAWRGALADYLRMPNTDLSLLMPLVFNNEQMSRRVARAFVLGQQF